MKEPFLVMGFVIMGLFLLTSCLVVYHLMKQQGRLLLRLDHVEQHLGIDAKAALVGVRPQEAGAPAGLAVETPMPAFELPDINGKVVSLEEFRGKRVLLINWSPQCGFCDMIASDLAGLQRDLRKRNVEMLLVSHGTAEANRNLAQEHGLECPILLQTDGAQAVEGFKGLGTPVAYLLDEQGQVARPIAIGADQVPALASEAATGEAKKKRLPGEKDLRASRIEREGLKAGTPAPPFHLPDLYGRTVSLEEYRGRKVLLVFTDPHCGPCDRLAPHLMQLHQEHRNNGLAVVMVGRGELEANRRKAEANGFEFPVVVQPKWNLSKKYGIFATPVAFLIDEQGAIARNVARGVDEIMALVPNRIAAGQEV